MATFNNKVLKHVLNHIGDFAVLILDNKRNVVFCNHFFEALFELDSKELTKKRLPEELEALIYSNDNTFELLLKNSEKIYISALHSKMYSDSNELPNSPDAFSNSQLHTDPDTELDLVTFKDLTYTRLKEKLKACMLNIAHVVNTSEDLEGMCKTMLNVLCETLGINSAYICFMDVINKTFYINSQQGLTELYSCHGCNYFDNNRALPDNKINCFNAYSTSDITSEPLKNHSIHKYVDTSLVEIDKNSIMHVPLFSDIGLIGLLHLIASPQCVVNLSLETDVIKLIASEITVGIKRIRLVQEIKQYADNLEKIIKLRTDQLREKDAQLIQSGKLATLGELATGIAHEINQPLGGISLITQGLIMAKSRGRLGDTLLVEKLTEIVAQVDRINKIIVHLRTFARQTDNIKVEVDVRKPLLDVFKLIGQQLVNREIDVILDIDEEIPIIMAEHNRLEQVFLNIISNASDGLEDMAKHVNKMISEDTLPPNLSGWRKRIFIRAFVDNSQLVLEFIDNGIGIPKEIINRIFEPFFTTKEVGKGTGLGLSITYGIVRDFSGTIEIESSEYKGTKFIIKFPIQIKHQKI